MSGLFDTALRRAFQRFGVDLARGGRRPRARWVITPDGALRIFIEGDE